MTGDDYLMKTEILVNDMKDIQKINHIVTQYPFDVWIHSNSGMVDAKSILGLFILSLNEPMHIVLDDDVNPDKLFKELSQYITFVEEEK